MNRDTHVLLLIFLEYVPFLDDDVMTNVNNFQIAKAQLHEFLSIFLIFCQFQPGVVYKSVSYIKKASALTATLTQ